MFWSFIYYSGQQKFCSTMFAYLCKFLLLNSTNLCKLKVHFTLCSKIMIYYQRIWVVFGEQSETSATVPWRLVQSSRLWLAWLARGNSWLWAAPGPIRALPQFQFVLGHVCLQLHGKGGQGFLKVAHVVVTGVHESHNWVPIWPHWVKFFLLDLVQPHTLHFMSSFPFWLLLLLTFSNIRLTT